MFSAEQDEQGEERKVSHGVILEMIILAIEQVNTSKLIVYR